MAMQAVSRAPVPAGNQNELLHEWVIDGDVRIVRLLREGENNLVCYVFNRVTNESSKRLIRSGADGLYGRFGSLLEYAKHISANMRPELGSNRDGPTCTAMLVDNYCQLVHTWYTGPNGEVEVKLFHKQNSLERICIAMNTFSNKQKIFTHTKDIGSENAQLYEPLITNDVDGVPNTLNFRAIRQVASPQALLPLVEPALRLLPTAEPIIQPDSASASSGSASSDLPPWGSQKWVVAKEWDLGSGKKVRLCRFGDNFCSMYAHSGDFSRAKVTPMPLPPNTSADDVFDDISTRQPFITPEEAVEYLIAVKSRFDDSVMIDEENWGVTLVDTGVSKCNVPTTIGIKECDAAANSPYSWGGHAVIVIEKIDDDEGYHLWRSDIVGGDNRQVEPRLFKVRRLDDFDGKCRSKTWIRAKSFVKKMIEEIKGQIELFNKGDSVGKLSRLLPAKKPFYSNRFRALMPAQEPLSDDKMHDKTYNCIEWSKELLSVACIKVPSDFSTLFLSTPVAAVSSIRGTVQEWGTQAAVSGAVGVGGALSWGLIGFAVGGPPGAALGAWAGGIGASSYTLLCANLHNHIESKEKYAQQKI